MSALQQVYMLTDHNHICFDFPGNLVSGPPKYGDGRRYVRKREAPKAVPSSKGHQSLLLKLMIQVILFCVANFHPYTRLLKSFELALPTQIHSLSFRLAKLPQTVIFTLSS
jgi:hypothetical protein